MTGLAARAAEAGAERALARPGFRKPQLATLYEEPPRGERWLHEIKHDGYRLLAAVGSDGVRIYTRNGKDWTDRFSQIVPDLSRIACDNALIDGEAVVIDSEGRSDFKALQAGLKDRKTPLIFFAFDLLVLNGEDWTGEAQTARKRRLEKLLDESGLKGHVRYSDHIAGQGEAFYEKACSRGLEGIVSKDGEAAYRHRRGRAWRKVKCVNRQEFVIAGFTESDSAGKPFASLILGYYQDGALVYAGRVGTGFPERLANALARAFGDLEREDCPFDEGVPKSVERRARWLQPELVGEVSFTERTAEGHLRHPAFQGLRKDKAAADITRERPGD